MKELNTIYQGDCLQVMREIADKSIDLICCDLPYGVTQNPEDKPLPLDILWKEYKRILKDGGVIVLTSQFPFTLDLILSNKEWFKYDLIWDKQLVSGFLNANKMPLRVHEHILVFYKKCKTYNPQKTAGAKSHSKGKPKTNANNNYGEFGFIDNGELLGELKHPTSILSIPKPHPSVALHRTEKPVALAEWIIKTYTNKGAVVLDNCIGCGWTAIAAKKNGRNFIGIELRQDFVEIALKRVEQTKEEVMVGDSSPT
jgi:site-specific DNA-methyltransferase (adenine-specific)